MERAWAVAAASLRLFLSFVRLHVPCGGSPIRSRWQAVALLRLLSGAFSEWRGKLPLWPLAFTFKSTLELAARRNGRKTTCTLGATRLSRSARRAVPLQRSGVFMAGMVRILRYA